MHAMQFSLFDEDQAPTKPLVSGLLANVQDLQIPTGFAAFAPQPRTKDHPKAPPEPIHHSPAARPTASEDLAGAVPPPPRRGRPPKARDADGNIIDSSSPDVAFNGYCNSSTYLVDLYLSNDPDFMRRVYALVDPANPARPMSASDLSKMVQVRKATEEQSNRDDYETGFDGRSLVLDYWAEGKINWAELADLYTSEARQLVGTQPVALDVLGVIAAASVEGKVVRLNSGQLKRDLYIGVDKVFKAMGSHWNRKLQGHVFGEDPVPLLEHLLQSGLITRPAKAEDFGAFFTPLKLATSTVRLADLEPGMRVLEPNAGQGALLSLAAEIVGIENCVAVEIQPHLAQQLKGQGYTVFEGDFMSQRHWGPNMLFDRALLNPPFSGQADIDHVLHAWSMLARRGRLVAIMSAGVSFRQNKKTVEFRDLVNSVGGKITPNPEGSFKESGTNVHTVTVVMDKPDRMN